MLSGNSVLPETIIQYSKSVVGGQWLMVGCNNWLAISDNLKQYEIAVTGQIDKYSELLTTDH
jgi:hypothetical protein